MMDLLLQMGLSNACFALVLALVAVAVGSQARRPHLAHLLWLLVFVRLVTPPLVTIPLGTSIQRAEHVGPSAHVLVAGTLAAVTETAPTSPLPPRLAALWNCAQPCLVTLWLLGSLVVFVWSIVRVWRFKRLLAAQCDDAPPGLHQEAERIGQRLGLATTPTICTVSAHLSPMVWWTGGPVRVVLPRALLEQMDAQDWQWILAHELAHVRRRDYLVRWVEWLACVVFWWNPVVWWAQRNLRAMEEICCDDLVLLSLHPKPKSYADSLLSAVESLARPAVRVPAMASEINSGGGLERRFRMMVTEKSQRWNSRWSRIIVLGCALAVLPLGLASAQDYQAVGKRLQQSVQKGEITQQQADAMMAVLKKQNVKKDKDFDQVSTGPTKVKKDLGAAVKSDKISKKDTVKKSEPEVKGIKEKVAVKKDQDSDKTADDLMKVKKDLGEAVEAGKISKKDAAKKYAAIKTNLLEKKAGEDQGKTDLDAAWKKLQAKVRAGELTKEQALDQMTALKQEAVKKDQDSEKAATAPTKVKKDLGAGVETGKLGKENAPKKDIKKKPTAQPDYDAIGRGLKAAVQAGKLTKEEAKAKWEAIKKEAAGGKGEN